MKKLLLFVLLFTLVLQVSAQYFQTGQDPASIRWRQLHTKNFQLIYPDYYENQAQKLAWTLETVYPYGSFSLKYNPGKMPVVLHTQTIKSNGLVAWAPRRAEFYTTPHQGIYQQDWLEQLALHEFRHVVQLTKVNSNLPRWIKFLLGEQATALAFGGWLPWWFIEGDAVITETALSTSGRGRLPSFLMEQKAQVIEKGVYSYDKAYFGSYRHFVPNHYTLGYFLTGNIRARHGSSIWEEVLTQVGQKPLSFFPMKQVLKKRTGLNTAENYRSVFDSLRVSWISADENYMSVPFQVISRPGKFFESYTHNHWLNDSELFSYKTAFDKIPSFVKMQQDGEEIKLLSPGSVFRESLRGLGEWIVWSEQVPDMRWHHSGRSVIRLFNATTGIRFHFKPEHKAFSPAISPDKMKVAVVESDFSSNYYLSVYTIPDGNLLHRYQSPDNNYFFSPEWIGNEKVAAIKLSDAGKNIVTVDFSTQEMVELHQTDLGEIKHLRMSENWLYFIGSYSGKNSLFRLNLGNLLIEQVYEPRFGVESPAVSPDGKTIILSDYTSDGFRLIQIPASQNQIKPLSETEKGTYSLAEKLAVQENGVPVFPDSLSTTYVSEKYSKAKQLLNFHSWAPVNIDTEEYQFSPGVSLMSQDKLGISELVLGYKWDLTEQTGRLLADYSFKGWYPVIDLKFSHGPRASEYWMINQQVNNQGAVISQDTLLKRYTWGQTNTSVNVRLPLNLERGPFNRLFQPEVQYAFNYYKAHESTPGQFHTGSFHSLGYRLYIHQLLKQSYLDVYPDFGLVLDGEFRHSPFGSIDAGQIKALQSVLYLPGLLKNHGLRLYGGAQQKTNNGSLGFSDVVRYARRWGRINTTEIYTGGADYKLPLLYPDWNIAGLLYLRRIKASLFADYSRLKGNFYNRGEITGRFTEDISSLGTELTFDVNMLRFYAPTEIGFRASYLPELKDVYFNFLFSIDFTSF